jgi:chitin disaccharide deacetylase
MSESTACTPFSDPRPCARLVVSADDFGISPRINEGVVRAHREGIVTSASLMAVGRAFEHAVQCCRDTPTLDIGVHLTLTAEQPLLTSRSSLIGGGGRFPESAGPFLRRWLTCSLRQADVQAEWSAQIERILAQGIRLTHLDSHQHVHCLPGLANLSQRLAKRYGIPFVRVPVEGLRGGQWSSLHGIKRLFGATALGCCWMLARLTGAKKTKWGEMRFLGFHDGGRLDELRLKRMLRALRPGQTYELMCHPGLRPDEPDVQRWAYRHEVEMHALIQPSIRSEIATRGIQLCSFAELAKL